VDAPALTLVLDEVEVGMASSAMFSQNIDHCPPTMSSNQVNLLNLLKAFRDLTCASRSSGSSPADNDRAARNLGGFDIAIPRIPESLKSAIAARIAVF
jgi:hypothetical protein